MIEWLVIAVVLLFISPVGAGYLWGLVKRAGILGGFNE